MGFNICRTILKTLSILVSVICPNLELYSQAPEPPLPIEVFFGHNTQNYQMVVKRKFTPESKFAFFGLATYTASYKGEMQDNRLITIAQVSYNIGKGFGLMAGGDMNSVTGFSPIVGPQHNYASKEVLAVTVASFFLNEDNDLKIFGLYEYKPAINERLSLYTRLQFIYNQNLTEGTHNRSYLYLRAGFKINSLILGTGVNLDQFGSAKVYKENYGLFVRWEFR